MLCKCGCGEEVNKGRKFILGHQCRGKNNPMYGVHNYGNRWNLTKETKKKMSKNHADFRGENNPFFKKHHTLKSKLKYRKTVKQKYKSGYVNPMKGKTRLDVVQRNWRGGISKLPYGFEFNKKLKQQIKERDNFTCQLCKDEILHNTQKKFLTIHHIDYDKKNNVSNNLIALCNFCNLSVNKDRTDWTKFFQMQVKT
jgi:5-methylcytosine-specific restriction endonuclease McrA